MWSTNPALDPRPTHTQIEDDAPVYDVLDESEYEELVRTRRQREDFVVDDGAFTVHNACAYAGWMWCGSLVHFV